MSAPYHNLLSKADRSLVAYLVSKEAGTTDDVFPGKRSGVVSATPATICYASHAKETMPNSSVFDVEAEVSVWTQAAIENPAEQPLDLEVASERRVAKTFDSFFEGRGCSNEAVAIAITAAARAKASSDPVRSADLADYTCLEVRIGDPEAGFDENTGMWVDRLPLILVCCPKDVS